MKKSLLTILYILCIIPLFASQQTNSQNPFDGASSDSTNIYEIQKLKLYPNPANDYLTVEYDVLYIKEAKFQIYNSIGSVVYTKTLKEKQDNLRIQVSEYKSGLYFCSLQIDGKLLNTRKILINH
ncbi:MAG: T9SS type A sorting domain-containing protein [Bacteroidetes bacterium]|nr:T9SS type A sorting domain-containing protein [Bacteroidota bacterium]